ncbi:replication factor A protein 3 [Fomitopsis betulina]|nr:replication factor A protein 3 [Fomitopsis betulina]
MAENVSPRVNAARLAQYIGRTVRLTGKVIRSQGDVAILQAPDGGEVSVKLNRDTHLTSPIVEVIGTVIDAATIKVLAHIDIEDELDLDITNDTVELWHDPRFAKMVMQS